jgi:hypothetical protein
VDEGLEANHEPKKWLHEVRHHPVRNAGGKVLSVADLYCDAGHNVAVARRPRRHARSGSRAGFMNPSQMQPLVKSF